MKAYNAMAVKLTSVRRKPVRRKPVSPQTADTVTSPVPTPSFPDGLTTIVSHAKQVESTSPTQDDRTFGQTSKSAIEVSDALLNRDLSKHPRHSQFIEELPAPEANTPQFAMVDRDTLERAQTAPVQLGPAQSFMSEDKKRRGKKAIRNGIVLYITIIS